jgi:hypothetical protein
VKTTWKWAKSTWTVYEQDFLPCSFGGRPKLGADRALRRSTAGVLSAILPTMI